GGGAGARWGAGGAGPDAGARDVGRIATGLEVWSAVEAAKRLAAEAAGRVVSMPCWELFDAQPQAYREEVLPPAVDKRLAVEAGVSLGWERWVGDRGATLALDRFGASAPGATVLARLWFPPGDVAARARGLPA